MSIGRVHFDNNENPHTIKVNDQNVNKVYANGNLLWAKGPVTWGTEKHCTTAVVGDSKTQAEGLPAGLAPHRVLTKNAYVYQGEFIGAETVADTGYYFSGDSNKNWVTIFEESQTVDFTNQDLIQIHDGHEAFVKYYTVTANNPKGSILKINRTKSPIKKDPTGMIKHYDNPITNINFTAYYADELNYTAEAKAGWRITAGEAGSVQLLDNWTINQITTELIPYTLTWEFSPQKGEAFAKRTKSPIGEAEPGDVTRNTIFYYNDEIDFSLVPNAGYKVIDNNGQTISNYHHVVKETKNLVFKIGYMDYYITNKNPGLESHRGIKSVTFTRTQSPSGLTDRYPTWNSLCHIGDVIDASVEAKPGFTAKITPSHTTVSDSNPIFELSHTLIPYTLTYSSNFLDAVNFQAIRTTSPEGDIDYPTPSKNVHLPSGTKIYYKDHINYSYSLPNGCFLRSDSIVPPTSSDVKGNENYIFNLKAGEFKLTIENKNTKHTQVFSVTRAESPIENASTSVILFDQDTIYGQDLLTWTYKVGTGYRIKRPITSYRVVGNYTLNAQSASPIPYYLTINKPGVGINSVEVQRSYNGNTQENASDSLSTNSQLYYGDKIKVIPNPNGDYTVNNYTNNYTVDSNSLSSIEDNGRLIIPTISGTLKTHKLYINCQSFNATGSGLFDTISANLDYSRHGTVGPLYNGSILRHGDKITPNVTLNEGCYFESASTQKQYEALNDISLSYTARVIEYNILMFDNRSDIDFKVKVLKSPLQQLSTDHPITKNSSIFHGDVYRQSFKLKTGYKTSWTYDSSTGRYYKDTDPITGDISLWADMDFKNYKLNIPKPGEGVTNVTAKCNGKPINSGGVIHYGDTVTISATVDPDYTLNSYVSSYTVNESTLSSMDEGGVLTVNKVTATIKKFKLTMNFDHSAWFDNKSAVVTNSRHSNNGTKYSGSTLYRGDTVTPSVVGNQCVTISGPTAAVTVDNSNIVWNYTSAAKKAFCRVKISSGISSYHINRVDSPYGGRENIMDIYNGSWKDSIWYGDEIVISVRLKSGYLYTGPSTFTIGVDGLLIDLSTRAIPKPVCPAISFDAHYLEFLVDNSMNEWPAEVNIECYAYYYKGPDNSSTVSFNQGWAYYHTWTIPANESDGYCALSDMIDWSGAPDGKDGRVETTLTITVNGQQFIKYIDSEVCWQSA